MAHMEQQIYHGDYYAVETSAGREIIPEDIVNRTIDVTGEDLLNYLEGKPYNPDETLERKTGWLARMSAPGYMDCTNWTVHDSEEAAKEYLEEMYGDD